MSTTANEGTVSLSIETDEPGWGSLTDFVDQLRDADLEGVSIETRTLTEPRKSWNEIAVWATVIASSVRVAGPTLVALLGELLHRPGKTRVHVTITDENGDTREIDVVGENVKPSEFATTIQALEKAFGAARRSK